MSRISDLAGFTTSLSSTQDLSVGVITAVSFYGDGSGLTGVANTDFIVGTAITMTTGTFTGKVSIDGSIAETGGGTVTYNVTVVTKDSTHRYNGQGFGSGYAFDGLQAPFLQLTPGRTYRFDQSDSSNSGHPLLFYYDVDKNTQYTTNVTTSGTPGSDGYTEIIITDTTPNVLHYQCSVHAYMGNAVQTNSNKVDSPYQIDGLSGANITGIVTATSFEGDGAGLTGLNIPSSSDWRDNSLF